MTNQYQLLPDLTADEYMALKDDIAERGVQVAVEYDENGEILDGHHRVRACQELGITDWPRIVRHGMTEQQKHEHVIRLNLARRHLNESQRAMIAARLATLPKGRPAENRQNCPFIPQPEAAELLNVSPRSVKNARVVLDEAPPETVAKVENGELAVSRDTLLQQLGYDPDIEREKRGAQEAETMARLIDEIEHGSPVGDEDGLLRERG